MTIETETALFQAISSVVQLALGSHCPMCVVESLIASAGALLPSFDDLERHRAGLDRIQELVQLMELAFEHRERRESKSNVVPLKRREKLN